MINTIIGKYIRTDTRILHAFFKKQHSEAELLLFENYSHSSFTLSPKNNRTIVSIFIGLIIMKRKTKMKNRSHKCDINRTWSRLYHNYSRYKKSLSFMMFICIK